MTYPQQPQQYAPQPGQPVIGQPVQPVMPQGQPMGAISGSMDGGITMRSFGVGRLVAFLPKHRAVGTKFDKVTPQDQIVCDVVVLDGGPVDFGGKANNSGQMIEPDIMRVVPAPYFLAENVIVAAASLLKSVARGLANPTIGQPARAVVGRLWQDAMFRNAWKQREATQQDMDAFNAWNAQVMAGAFVNPTPQRIPGVAPVQQAQPVYAGNVDPWAAQAPPPPQYAQPQQVAPTPSWPVPNPAQVAQPMAYAPPIVDQPVPGYESQWPMLNENQKAQIRQMAAQQGQPAGPAPTYQ